MNWPGRIGMTILIFMGLMAPGYTTLAEFDFSGSFNRGFMAVQVLNESDNAVTTETGSKDTLRLNCKDLIGDSAKIEGSFDLTLLAGGYLTASPDNASIEILFETRKLYLSLFWDQCTLTVGRQIINYGVGYLFSPIDCFSTVDPRDAGFSRIGSDIIRVQAPLGNLAGLEGVATISGDNGTSALKAYANLWGFDFSLTGIYKQPDEELLLGLTFKGDLGVGVHGELVGHSNPLAGDGYFEGMAGMDYSFLDGRLFLLMEYYYNGNPINPGRLTLEDLLAIKRAFLGKEYLFGRASWTINELCAMSVNRISNLEDGSSIEMLQFRYNAWPRTNLYFNGRFFQGDINGIHLGVHPTAEYTIGVEVKF
ncbi:MAG: hypothetical protein K6U80_14090 [Firmicutes bacterium]|nr:hypothetical protein [Bacillota bacterium]